jgi:DNA-binding PadR family transcriptional regulator
VEVGAMFGRGWGGFGRPSDRFFEKGDLKYVILELLQEKPSHGYEIIRALEERSRGFYTPSPGAIYPTLQMLEDLDYVTVRQQDGKKVYTITEAGRAFLAEREQVVDDIWARTRDRWGPEVREEIGELVRELRDLGRLFRRRAHRPWPDRDQLRRIREVVARARREIEAILTEEKPRGTPSGASF